MLLMNKEILLKDLNIKDYKETWDYQTNLLQEIVDTKINNRKSNFQVTTKNHFLFVEHPHVYTLGKSGDLRAVGGIYYLLYPYTCWVC